MLENLTREDFLPHVGTPFRVAVPGGGVDLVLNEVKDLGPRPARLVKPGTRQSGFALRFLGPAETLLPQRIWTLGHAAMGPLPIFLVPIGREDGGLVYEAVFN